MKSPLAGRTILGRIEAATDELMLEDRKPEEWLLSEAVPAALPPRGRRNRERWRALQSVPGGLWGAADSLGRPWCGTSSAVCRKVGLCPFAKAGTHPATLSGVGAIHRGGPSESW